jgi:dihydroorotate dehydrogenase electron transfer subunit
MPGVHLICIEASDLARMARPGQFVMIECGRMLRRPLSIHNVTEKGEVCFLAKVIGQGTSWIADRTIHDTLDLLGPFGNGFTLGAETDNVLLIAGGIGIAPITFLARHAISLGKQVTLLMGACTSTDLYPGKHLPVGIQTFIATDDGSKGTMGPVTGLVTDFIDQADQVFACGPLPMYETLSLMIQDGTITKPVQVSLEVRMGCGLGTCYSCSIKTNDGMRKVCHDGPVFDLKNVVLNEVKI